MKRTIYFSFLLITGVLFLSSSCAVKRTASRTVTDIDGNKYNTVVIGDQEWMSENLKTTRYNDGTPIPNVSDINEWRLLNTPAYIWYGNDITKKEIYGALYNWFAVGTGKLCPEGWHVASDDDWKKLETLLGMTPEQLEGTGMRGTDQGGKLKEAGNRTWIRPNEAATIEFGLSIVPSGRLDRDGVFVGNASGGTIWTSTETSLSCAYYRHFAVKSKQIGRNPLGEKKYGLAVRCIKND
ncbi:MAG: hypothetical protein GX126_08770 [Bacteroidales bacterium]|nr:hypothetical protein [Bacteroidales bacterium]